MAQVRSITIRQERLEDSAALQHAASFPRPAEEWKDCEGLVAANKDRCMRCGRRSSNNKTYKEHVKDQSGCEKTPNASWEDGATPMWEGTTW